ncbi:PEP-CTERM sorting domain-containing protein [Massilia sp. 9I]|uniref:PEP-CTERM sorting domain-containing protein n=1 Tax=Massilia sp. 9I TaxID=2653152 RepID=UPI0012F14D1F|nr:PEP-CTERM sorting domain-containing protein [Massilia sp. 9I]VXB62138.1 PEP-CTERM protein-sorting domain [Massilia sp. 9I]
MILNKLSATLIAATLAVGASAPAQAVTLVTGDLKITINAFDASTIGYGNTVGTKCESIAQCNSVATKPAVNAYGGEDTWGIFSVQSISRVSNGSLIFTAGTNGEYLTGMFGGIKDTYVEVSGSKSPSTLALGTGGWLNMYLTGQNYNASFGPNGRQGEFGYRGITNIGGTLALSAVFAPGVLGGDPEYTYSSNYANNTISGGGQAFLDVTGGSLKKLFDTNLQQDPNGGMHDLFMKITYGQTGASAGPGWTVDISGDVQGNVPEPGSLALLGLGFAGLAARRRRG